MRWSTAHSIAACYVAASVAFCAWTGATAGPNPNAPWVDVLLLAGCELLVGGLLWFCWRHQHRRARFTPPRARR